MVNLLLIGLFCLLVWFVGWLVLLCVSGLFGCVAAWVLIWLVLVLCGGFAWVVALWRLLCLLVCGCCCVVSGGFAAISVGGWFLAMLVGFCFLMDVDASRLLWCGCLIAVCCCFGLLLPVDCLFYGLVAYVVVI